MSVQLIGCSDFITTLRQTVQQVAECDTTVLLLGESGVGKDVIAQTIHAQSTRKDKPFITVNCGAIPADLIESELFGYEKGSIMGATSARAGCFELAEGGSLFLDEIGDMPLTMQIKLLRILEEKRFERIGGTQSITVNVRIIASTNQDLEQAIKENKFREDLYYRLNVFPINIVSLRERSADIPMLLDHFCEETGKRLHRTIKFSDEAKTSLQTYKWPGNIRELANFVERMLILYPNSTIENNQLDEKYKQQKNFPQSDLAYLQNKDFKLKEYLENTEIKLIVHALEQNNGNVSRAARTLAVGRTTLIEKMRRLGIHATDYSAKI